MKKVCIYCASSNKVDKIYFDEARRLGKILAENNIEVNFGGGAKGLMGSVADSIIENKGKITGIMPHFMKKVEWEHKKVTEFVFVNDMAERKKKLLENTDAVIALPGGSGTLEELLEAFTLKRLGFYTKPIIIINTNNFYDLFLQFIDKTIRENFMNEIHNNVWTVIDKPKQIFDAYKSSQKHSFTIEMAAVDRF